MNRNRVFILFATVVLGLIFLFENLNDRFWLNDFKVYYWAARSLMAGGTVYGVPLGLDTGFYKYSPAVLLPFVPISLIDYYVASVLHFIFIVAATVTSILIIDKILREFFFSAYVLPPKPLMVLSLIVILDHLFRELHLGNMNMFIVLFLSGALLRVLQKKELQAGILLGMAVLIKPYLLVFSVPLFLHKKWKSLIVMVLTMIVAVLLVFLSFGYTKGFSLHSDWIKAVFYHGEYLTSNHTIISLLRQYVFSGFLDSYHLPVFAVAVSVLLPLAFFSLRNRMTDPQSKNFHLIFSYFLLLALLPNLLITDTEHFLFSLPFIMTGLYFFFELKKFQKVFFIVFVVLYGISTSGILGTAAGDKMEVLGLLGFSNFVLVIFVSFILLKKQAVLDKNRKSLTHETKT